MTVVKQTSPIAGMRHQRVLTILADSLPLLVESFGLLFKRDRQRLGKCRQGAVSIVSETETKANSLEAEIDLADQGDVAIGCGFKLPVHLKVVGQVGPAVGDSHVPAGSSSESRGTSHRQVIVIAIGSQHQAFADRFNESVVAVAS